jgi:putative ABC transport system permease protein
MDIKKDIPDVSSVARLNPVELFGAGSNDLRRVEQVENTHESGFTYADGELLQMLDVKFIYGNAKTALAEPNTIVLTKSKADKYFPREDPVGKVMIIANNDSKPYTVGGVIEDPLSNSHLQYHFYMTLSGLEFYPGEQTNWLASNYPTYILVNENVNLADLEKKLYQIAVKYYLPRLIETGFPNIEQEIKNLGYELQPVKDIYLNEVGVGDGLNHGDIRFVWLSGAVAVFILLIACINFINLSTAKSANRAKEVGLRKVVGSLKRNLVNQFLSESILFSLCSFILAIVIAFAVFPLFTSLVARQLQFPWGEWWLAPVLLASALVIGVLAGLYPSFYLSAFKPIQVLKGNVARGSKNSMTRSVLVVFQFTTSIVLIIGTFIIYRQMQYIMNVKIGFDKEQVMVIQGTNLLGEKVVTFKQELLRQRNIQSVTVTDYLPIQGTKRNGNGFWNEGKQTVDTPVGTQFWRVDNDYIKTLGMKIIEGRDFSKEMVTDSVSCIINQALAKELNLKDPIGKKIVNYRNWDVIGVVENFNFESLREDVRPLCLVLGQSNSMVSVKTSGKEMSSVIESVTSVWKQFAPQQPIRYTFLDQSYAKMYEDVERMGRIFTTFAILAILVACLGLFGLSSFMVEQRSKEISIRLVLGASIKSIFGLLTRNFVILVLLSFLIAVPIGWYVMDKWLQEFVYRTEITIDVFVMAGVVALLIALITISYQAVRAGMMRPVENLKGE